ncbi:M23 family metallopeptidase [Flavobacterium terrae]|uniref:Peptidase family M23 n=1 Tax=Flavobacterium terrae TaxID=415425 RepID=A0A1M6DCM9_9FLAO|nr:M23 family metallopeptidase [Flavobacterium terrae]SHI71006.1 Peptidase family M23 [Flavobacterium terrae]
MRIAVAAIFLLTNFLSAQDKYPKDYFGSPLDIPLSLAGSFGELRPNHFHSGIDFRTQKKEGLPVYASADGFISRIKISTAGYGKSIYIDHPNGFTTVYAHLQRCAPEIQAVLNKEHYDKQNYEIEIKPKPNELIVKKGDLIAYSGNTGGSSGPHLHFEIRDTQSEFIINPLYFGLCDSLKDTKKPILNSILAYPLDESSQINGSAEPIFLSLNLQKDGTYITNKIVANGKISFAVNAYDVADNSYGKNGIFKMTSFVNGLPYFGYEFETFSFDETKLINTFIDYPRYQSQKQRFQKLFVGYFFPPSIIKTRKDDGILTISSNLTSNYKVILEDFNQNKTEVIIPVSYGVLPVTQKKKEKITPYFLKTLNEHSYVKDDISVFIPEKTFYEDFYLDFNVKNNELFLHNDSVAVSKNITITFDVSKIPVDEREKMFIANLDRGRTEFNTTYKKENTFTIYTKKLGKFFLFKDEEAPRIYNPSFKEGDVLDEAKTLKISISDNLSGIKEYNAYLNGKWILMEYETKQNRLTHNFTDAIFVNGKNDFKLIVKDNMGNSSTFESYFTKTK